MRASCCVRVLPPSTRARRADVAQHGAAERDRIDAGMEEEAVILDGDEGVLQVRRDLRDRHVVALLVEAEPAAAVGGVEPGVADAARQLVDGVALLGEPAERDRGDDDERVEQVLRPAEVGAQQHSHHRHRPLLLR